MKTNSNIMDQLLHTAAVVIVSLTAAVLLTGQRGTVREQYQIINVDVAERPAVLQTQLNELGNQGWKVRASVGNWVILTSER